MLDFNFRILENMYSVWTWSINLHRHSWFDSFYFIQGSHIINQTNKKGLTSLHLATQGDRPYTHGGHTPVVDVLLSHGADINFLTAEGQSCLHLAAELCNKADNKVKMTHTLTQVQSYCVQHFSQFITCRSSSFTFK